MRRTLILFLFFAAGLLPVDAEAVARQTSDAGSRPNIVVIMADDLGYSDLGSYGAALVQTPNLDRLAAQGLRFTQFYNNGKCTPTRASLLSGLWWQQTRNLKRENHVTIAEVLRQAGYHTMWVGKWHVAGTPAERGFERTFGFLNGAINYFTGVGTGGQTNNWRLDGEKYKVSEEGFYATHAFTNRAIQFVGAAAAREQPFFLYLAYNAPHYPLQAPEETIQKYRLKFMSGWGALRQERYERQVEMGLIPERWALSPRNATPAPQYPRVPAWEEVLMERQWSEDLKMAVYAAMVEEMDRGIGRLMETLRGLGIEQNTLVIFLSDNGGCPFEKTRTPAVPPGPAASFHNYETPWAHLSNTPFRGYKRQAFEGGISTPFIAYWPAVIGPERRGETTDRIGHVIDIMPTLVEVAKAEYPSRYDGHKVLPMEGESLLPVLRGKQRNGKQHSGRQRNGHEALFWEYARNAAVRVGRWKLVTRRGQAWELYDMEADRTELHDLAEERPKLRDRLIGRYRAWAERVGARLPQEEKNAGRRSDH